MSHIDNSKSIFVFINNLRASLTDLDFTRGAVVGKEMKISIFFDIVFHNVVLHVSTSISGELFVERLLVL